MRKATLRSSDADLGILERRTRTAEELHDVLSSWEGAPEAMVAEGRRRAADRWAEQCLSKIELAAQTNESSLINLARSDLFRWQEKASQECSEQLQDLVAQGALALALEARPGEAEIALVDLAQHITTNPELIQNAKRTGFLLEARDALATNEHGRCIRAARQVAGGQPDELTPQAFEILVHAYDETDTSGEGQFKALQDWERCLQALFGSVAGYAGRIQLEGEMGRPERAKRAEEILSVVSRLIAELQAHGDKTSALRLCRELIEEGFHDWIDPVSGVSLTELSRLVEGSNDQRSGSLPLVSVIEVERRFGSVDFDELQRLLRLPTSIQGGFRAVVLGSSDFRENRFPVPEGGTGSVEQFQRAAEQVCSEPENLELKLQPILVQLNRGWNPVAEHGVILRHQTGPEFLQHIAFLLIPVTVGAEVEISLTRLVDASGPVTETFPRIQSLMSRKPEDIPGFLALEDSVIAVAKDCCRLLGPECATQQGA